MQSLQKDLVSVLSPCYNMAGYIARLLDSILIQTYPRIEMYVIDDGSSDGSADIVASYIPRFEARGYRLTCIHQPNSGQSAAIQTGLQHVRGEYLVWPDSDDCYASADAIAKMAETLEQASARFAMVRIQENMIEDGTDRILHVAGTQAHEEEPQSLFEDCLFGTKKFYFGAGAYMIRTATLFQTTELPIFTSKHAGQNWQLLLPILHSYRCKTILEPLYNVTVRPASHSRGQYAGYEKELCRIDTYEETLVETLKKIRNLPDTLRDRYTREVRIDYLRKKYRLASAYGRKEDMAKSYDALQCWNALRTKERIGMTMVRLLGISAYCRVRSYAYKFYRRIR